MIKKRDGEIKIKKIEILKFLGRLIGTEENSIDNLMNYNKVDWRNKTEIFIFMTRQFTLQLSKNIKKFKDDIKLPDFNL